MPISQPGELKGLSAEARGFSTNVSRSIDLVLCTGMPRSGSTWSYNVCMSLLEAAYPTAPVRGLYSENFGAALTGGGANWESLLTQAQIDRVQDEMHPWADFFGW